MRKPHRMNLFIAEDQNEKLEKWSNRLAISKSNLINLAIRAGLDSIIRAVEPAESLTDEQWARILKMTNGEGVDLGTEKKTDNPAG